MTGPPPSSSFVRPTAAAAGSVGVVVFPNFLIGAFAPAIKDDLGFGDAELGAMFTVGYFVSVLALQVGGPLADLGAQRAIRLGLLFAVGGSGFIAVGASAWVWLVVGFSVARVAEAIVQPATNALVAGTVVVHRRGLAMGMKQSAVPVATTFAGLAVPVLGSTLGWRGVFGLVAVAAVPAALAVPHAPARRVRIRTKTGVWREPDLRMAAVAGGLSAGAVIAASGFLVTAAVDDAGFSAGGAGLLLTLGGVVMTGVRVSLGALADRRQFNRFRVVAMLLAAGTVAYPLLALGTVPSMIAGTLFVYGVGWAFPGLFLLGVMEAHPDTPGAATAVVQTGVRVGAMASPLAFGLMVEAWGFAAAWMLPTALSALGAVAMYRVSLLGSVPEPSAA